jgi:hypothetical protein
VPIKNALFVQLMRSIGIRKITGKNIVAEFLKSVKEQLKLSQSRTARRSPERRLQD